MALQQSRVAVQIMPIDGSRSFNSRARSLTTFKQMQSVSPTLQLSPRLMSIMERRRMGFYRLCDRVTGCVPALGKVAFHFGRYSSNKSKCETLQFVWYLTCLGHSWSRKAQKLLPWLDKSYFNCIVNCGVAAAPTGFHLLVHNFREYMSVCGALETLTSLQHLHSRQYSHRVLSPCLHPAQY